MHEPGWLEPRLMRLERFMNEILADTSPERFGEVLCYPLFGGGKRIRPALVFAAFDAICPGADPEPAIAAASAVELVHTYSLVHDDLPCMDDDDMRRGRPTAHVVFGQAAAVLAGDALLTEAFSVLARAPWEAERRIEAVRILAQASGRLGMVGGQADDIGIGGKITSIEALERLHAKKTGALIAASASLGALAAGADPQQRAAIDRYGPLVGLAFQLADDLLDAEQDSGEDGPPSFVNLLGAERTRQRASELSSEARRAISGLPAPGALAAIARFAIERSV